MSSSILKFCLGILVFPCVLLADSSPSDVALKNLIDGNERFITDERIHPNQSEMHRNAVVEKQVPFAAILSCSDSRVPTEMIFDQGLGDLFVLRVAGNVVGTIEDETICFAVEQLNVPLVMVLGHQNCGAVQVALEGGPIAKDLPVIVGLIEPYVKEAKKGHKKNSLDHAVQLNARGVKKHLEEHKILKTYVEKGQLKIVAAYYDFTSGKVFILD